MSDVVDLPIVMLQKAQHAAETAAASAKMLENEVGLRLMSIEARLVAVEGRLTGLAAGQNSHAVALMRIADTLSEHTATLSEHTARFDRIETMLADIAARLPPAPAP